MPNRTSDDRMLLYSTQEGAEEAIKAMSAEAFKEKFLEWFGESDHAGWDGFEDDEVDTFRQFLADAILYAIC